MGMKMTQRSVRFNHYTGSPEKMPLALGLSSLRRRPILRSDFYFLEWSKEFTRCILFNEGEKVYFSCIFVKNISAST